MKIAFVTNICAHYRVKTFETLARYYTLDYYFFSVGDDWYWQQEHGVQAGKFHYEYLPGFRLGRTRITPTLLRQLWQGHYDVYIKCINGRFALPITYLIARLKRKPLILWTGIWMRLQTPAHRLFFPLTRYIYRHVNAIVVYGEHVKRYLVSEGVAPDRIFVTTHAVDNDAYNRVIPEEEKQALLQDMKIEAHQRIVLYLGRLVEEKGLDYLLNAFATVDCDDAVLVFVGTGPEELHLKQRTQSLGLEKRVRFVGYVPPEQTVSYYALAYVYVFPSVTTRTFKEPWGLVVNEAFNQGVPVIATEAVGAAAGGLVQDGVNGLIVPERDSHALADALQRILDAPELRARFSQNAKEIIADWDNERMVLGFRQAIDYVLSEK